MKPGAAIVNTTSEQGKVATKSMIVYAATKGAISSLTVGLSNLLAPLGIRVNALALGPVWTPIQPIVSVLCHARAAAAKVEGRLKTTMISRRRG